MRIVAHGFYRLLAILFVLAAMQAAGGTAPAQAGRIVGVVFDDSGSMNERIHLPAFGAQLLVSTLDGRPGNDRLLSIRLSTLTRAARSGPLAALLRSQPPVTPKLIADIDRLHIPDLPRWERIETPAAHIGLLDTIQKDWAKASDNTPYEPVELMLSHLVQSAGPDDDAFLVIITDGAFFDGRNSGISPGRAALAEAYQAYKARLKGRLRVEFVLIEGNSEVRDRVNEQGVRPSLLRTFNGSETDGRHDVTDTAALRRALTEIIARVSSTDRSDVQDVMRIDRDRVVIDSPFSITRIISIVTGMAGQDLPRALEAGSGRRPSVELESAMADVDRADGWRNERLSARTTHFRMFPAQPPGTLTLRYDRPVGKDLVLLFDTGVRLDLAVHDGAGKPVPPGADGVIEVLRGYPYTLDGTLVDEHGAVDFKTLPPSARFAAWTDRGAQRTGTPFTRDDARGRASGALPNAQAAEYLTGATFHLPGFVIKESARLKIRVVDPNVRYRMELTPVQPCPGCAANELRAELRPDAGTPPIGRLTLNQTGGPPSSAMVTLEGAPAWLILKDAAGVPVPPDKPVSFTDGAPLVFTLDRQLVSLREIGPRRVPFTIRLQAQAPHVGEQTLAGVMTVAPSDVSVTYTGNSRSATPAEPLVLGPDDLRKADQGIYFEIQGSPVEPDAGHVTVEPAGGMMTFGVQVMDHRITLIPAWNWWSTTCLLCATAPDEVTVRFRYAADVEPTVARAPLHFRPSLAELAGSCLGLLGAGLFAFYLLLIFRTFMTTHSFPKGSMVQINTREGALPSYEDLRQRNWRRWNCLLLRHSHARRSIAGVLLEARPGGATIILADSDPALTIERLGQSVAELRREQPNLREVPISWGDRLTRPRMPRSLVLVREFQN